MDPTPSILEGYDGLKGRHRTDLHCHNCNKVFIASFDYDVDGNHVVECAWCAHEHCRVIQKGKITADRWDTRMQRVNIEPRYVWRMPGGQTNTVSEFIRSAWLNRSDLQ